MANLLNNAVDFLAEVGESHMSDTVTIRRGLATTPVAAILGATRHEIIDGDGQKSVVLSTDFLIVAADYAFDEEVTLPAVGDEVVATIAGQTKTFEVSRFGGAPHYRPSDPHGVKLRIHTKLIESDP